MVAGPAATDEGNGSNGSNGSGAGDGQGDRDGGGIHRRWPRRAGSGASGSPRRRDDPAVRLALVIALGAMVPRLRTAAGGIETADEILWMGRSARFYEAVTSGQFGDASASSSDARVTMPGVPTMWVGAVGRAIWGAGRELGLWAQERGADFVEAESGLKAAQSVMAVTTAALLGVLVFLVARWVGWRAAAVAGVLLATEPFVVAHGAVLHTDELLALFGTGALVATALALGVPHRTPAAGQRWAAVTAGVLAGAAVLTKLSALMLLPSAGLLGAWAAARAVAARRRAGSGGGDRRIPILPALRRAAWWVGPAIAVVVLAYPALWVHPLGELQALRRTFGLASEGQWQFFLGEATNQPGPAFYLVALPLHVTPWFLLAGVAAAAGGLAWRRTRLVALALGCMAVPPFVVLSLASKQIDRYGLMVLVPAAVLVGAVAVPAAEALAERRPSAGTGRAGRRVRVLAQLASVVLVAHALVIAPWGLGYFNPALGGAHTAERAVVVGWGEGVTSTSAVIRRDRDGDCDGVSVFAFMASYKLSCGVVAEGDTVPDYVALYVAERQRLTDADLASLARGREVVGEVRRNGIVYVRVYGPSAEADPLPAADLPWPLGATE